MYLRDIALFLSVKDFEINFQSDFGFYGRYVCHFLKRRMRELKFPTEGSNQICVEGRRVPGESCPILGEHAAMPSVAFDRAAYEALDPDERHELFIGMLLEGFEKCARHHRIPLAELREGLEDFRRGGYKNEWTQKTKLLRPVGLKASLLCSMDTHRFVLTLVLERKGVKIFDQPIMTTRPDEIIFAYQIKDIVLDGDSVVVQDKFGKPTYTLRLDSLS